MKQRIIYKLRYVWRRLNLAFGFCPKCGGFVNWTRTGKPICPRGCGI